MNTPIRAKTTNTTMIAYPTVTGGDGVADDGLVNLTDIDVLCPFTVMLPDVLFAE